MTKVQLAWAAGFFDGEGSIFIRKAKRHKGGTTGKYYTLTTVECAAVQTRPEPLKKLLAVVKLGAINGPYQPKRKSHNRYWRWGTSGRPAVNKVLTMLWPYLTAPKREQARKCWTELLAAKTAKSPRLPPLPND